MSAIADWFTPILEPHVLALCLLLSGLVLLGVAALVGAALGVVFAVVWIARTGWRLLSARFRGVVGRGRVVVPAGA